MITADEYLEIKHEYCTDKGRPVPEHEVAEAYAEKRLSEQWKAYPENQPEEGLNYLIRWTGWDIPIPATFKKNAWVEMVSDCEVETPCEFMEIPK